MSDPEKRLTEISLFFGVTTRAEAFSRLPSTAVNTDLPMETFSFTHARNVAHKRLATDKRETQTALWKSI